MLKKDKFEIVFNTLFAIILSAALTIFIQVVNSTLSFENFLIGFTPSFAINFSLETYINLLSMGNAFARLFIKNEKNFAFHLLRIFAIVFIMAAVMSFLCMFIEMGFASVFLITWVTAFPMIFIVAYIIALIFFPIIMKSSLAICSKE